MESKAINEKNANEIAKTKERLYSDVYSEFIEEFNNIFKNKEELKVTGDITYTWFEANSVLASLGYEVSKKNTIKLLKTISEENKKKVEIPSKSGSNPTEIVHINEIGLYQLLLMNDIEAANNFKKYLYSILLPNIRRVSSEKSFRFNLNETTANNYQLFAQFQELKKLTETTIDNIDRQSHLLKDLSNKIKTSEEVIITESKRKRALALLTDLLKSIIVPKEGDSKEHEQITEEVKPSSI